MADSDKKDVMITFDTIFEMLRKEKDREELQELPATFFLDVVNYLKEKKDFMQKHKESLFGEDEFDKTSKQLQSILKVLRELYNRRERKIIVLAVNKAITNSHLIDTSKLLSEERSFFQDLTSVLVNYRGELLEKVSKSEIPSLTAKSMESLSKDRDAKDMQYRKDEQREEKEDSGISASAVSAESAEKPKELKNSPISNASEAMAGNLRIRFLDNVPKFIGPELEILGPFEKGSMHMLDSKIAEILINNSKAEQI